MTDRQLLVRFYLCLALFMVSIVFVGNGDLAEEYILGAEEMTARPARVIEVYRELHCDCPKLNSRKQWLRFQVAQKRDRMPCTVTCEYGKPQLIAESL